jgi:hypothetical protein
VGAVYLFLFCAVFALGYRQSAQFRPANFVSSALIPAQVPNGGRWQRVDNLASVGEFLREFLPKDAVVASAEEATIMYFSDREMLGLLGVSNPEITKMPLQPLTPLGELLIHRRRSYASVFKNRPDVIALYEPVALGDYSNGPNLLNALHDVLQNNLFNRNKVDIAYYRVGSFAALEKMGYRHITISYSDRLFSLYIGTRIYDVFVEKLLNRGFQYLGSDSITYSVNPELSKIYLPSVREISDTL